MVIDGSTQPEFAGSPLVELEGTAAGFAADGFTIVSGGSTLAGLAINRFGRHGIRIEGPGGNRIEGNHIGTDVSGLASLPNQGDGISIFGSSGNFVGGTEPGQRNVISGNEENGVAIASGTLSIDDISSFGPPPLGPPFTGTFAPHEPLAGFNGEDPNGEWVLNVRDQFPSFDDGHVRAFSPMPRGTPDSAAAVKSPGSRHRVISATATDTEGNTSEFSFIPQGRVRAEIDDGRLLLTGTRSGERQTASLLARPDPIPSP